MRKIILPSNILAQNITHYCCSIIDIYVITQVNVYNDTKMLEIDKYR